MMEERVEGCDQPPPLLQKRGRPRLGALDEAEIERYCQESLTPLTVAMLIGQPLLAYDVALRCLQQGHVVLVAQVEGVIGR